MNLEPFRSTCLILSSFAVGYTICTRINLGSIDRVKELNDSPPNIREENIEIERTKFVWNNLKVYCGVSILSVCVAFYTCYGVE